MISGVLQSEVVFALWMKTQLFRHSILLDFDPKNTKFHVMEQLSIKC